MDLWNRFQVIVWHWMLLMYVVFYWLVVFFCIRLFFFQFFFLKYIFIHSVIDPSFHLLFPLWSIYSLIHSFLSYVLLHSFIHLSMHPLIYSRVLSYPLFILSFIYFFVRKFSNAITHWFHLSFFFHFTDIQVTVLWQLFCILFSWDSLA